MIFYPVCPGPLLVGLGSGRLMFLYYFVAFCAGVWFHTAFEALTAHAHVVRSAKIASSTATAVPSTKGDQHSQKTN